MICGLCDFQIFWQAALLRGLIHSNGNLYRYKSRNILSLVIYLGYMFFLIQRYDGWSHAKTGSKVNNKHQTHKHSPHGASIQFGKTAGLSRGRSQCVARMDPVRDQKRAGLLSGSRAIPPPYRAIGYSYTYRIYVFQVSQGIALYPPYRPLSHLHFSSVNKTLPQYSHVHCHCIFLISHLGRF